MRAVAERLHAEAVRDGARLRLEVNPRVWKSPQRLHLQVAPRELCQYGDGAVRQL